MITAVATSVLLDVFTADRSFGLASKTALQEAMRRGRLVACEVVFAEVAASFPDPRAAAAALDTLPVLFEPLDRESALLAGGAWRE